MRLLVHCERIFIPNALSVGPAGLTTIQRKPRPCFSCVLLKDQIFLSVSASLSAHVFGPSRFWLRSSGNVGARLDSCWPWKR
jgi:hypothetical protein